MAPPRSVLCGLLVLAGLAGSCQTVLSKRPRQAEPAVVQRAHPVRVWNAVTEEGLVGEVVRFESEADGSPLYVVRNRWRQDLGVIDRLGRAYRFRPHSEDPDWLGTGTVGAGAARILEAASVELHEVALARSEAVSFELLGSTEARVEEASAPKGSDSRATPSTLSELPRAPEGSPQSGRGTRSKDSSDDPPSSPERG